MLHKVDDSIFITEFIGLACPFVTNFNLNPFIQESQILEAFDKNIILEFGGFKNFAIWLERNLRPGLCGFLTTLDIADCDTIFVLLPMNKTVPVNFRLAPLTEKVDYRDPDSMQTTRSLIGPFVKLSTKLKNGHHSFQC